ncbi:MAG TPA: C40 family peptidase [Candidatus Enterocloster excrementipullorum]|uniref:C40 family peptidase n=1 Tax=Candidatus Enterocloster excrementipullorum TaxID=2838559 RepID=A0A9D2SIU6_9FIRM|nr:C40 family peptidase [Candidatus Enterocloster excrementipullorum]
MEQEHNSEKPGRRTAGKHEDYKKRLQRIRRKRKGGLYAYGKYAAVGAAALLAAGGILGAVLWMNRGGSGDPAGREMAAAAEGILADGSLATGSAASRIAGDGSGALAAQDAAEEARIQAEKEEALDAYANLGIADVEEFLNVRDAAENGMVIGRLPSGGACDILETEGEWHHIRSGEVEGYVNSQYLLTGEEARERAMEEIEEMAVVTAESVNIRSEPAISYANVVGQAWTGDRYPVVSVEDGWIQVEDGYISADYADVRYALPEASELDQQTLALNQYQNLVISKVSTYLNVRSSPEDQGDRNIIGQLPSYAAGEIIETLDGWYHIRSGGIDGYISSDPQYTAVGQEARDLAYGAMSLMAIVNTERLNVRTEPNTESSIWTQISQEERYHVIQQLDGWVQIELDSAGEGEEIDGAYISIADGNAEVRYTLEEAIRFSPLDEAAGLRSRIANYALQFVGNPYVWGGTSLTNGADCSGFVQSVMRNFGISLPRTSRAQSQVGEAINSSEMQPGDLIFYANSSGTVNHVAMYIGNGQVVHASSARTGIRISNWNYRTPKVIRRVL